MAVSLDGHGCLCAAVWLTRSSSSEMNNTLSTFFLLTGSTGIAIVQGCYVVCVLGRVGKMNAASSLGE